MATTTLCPKHLKALLEANKTVPHDHSAMMGHGTSHNLHDGMIVIISFNLMNNFFYSKYLLNKLDELSWWL